MSNCIVSILCNSRLHVFFPLIHFQTITLSKECNRRFPFSCRVVRIRNAVVIPDISGCFNREATVFSRWFSYTNADYYSVFVFRLFFKSIGNRFLPLERGASMWASLCRINVGHLHRYHRDFQNLDC